MPIGYTFLSFVSPDNLTLFCEKQLVIGCVTKTGLASNLFEVVADSGFAESKTAKGTSLCICYANASLCYYVARLGRLLRNHG